MTITEWAHDPVRSPLCREAEAHVWSAGVVYEVVDALGGDLPGEETPQPIDLFWAQDSSDRELSTVWKRTHVSTE